jgi:TonB-linked SusC/RagA family outer membrane protein
VTPLSRRLVPALAALLLAAFAAPAAAQSGRIAGTVTDSSSAQPLLGVQVSVVGTRLGATTGADGRYVITNVPAGSHTVQVRRIGYQARQIGGVNVATDEPTTLDIVIATAPFTLEAQVVTGVVDPTSGTRTPFAVGRVDVADAPVPPSNAIETIQGKIAGVNIVPSGQPGGGTNIVLRTPTSINRSNTPLIVVDGVILAQSANILNGSTADLEALDIESVEVIKGAAAASLYGSRAASGVIQIRTKRGAGLAEGGTRVVVRSEVGSNSLGGKIDWSRYHDWLMNDLGEYVDEAGNVVELTQRVQDTVWKRFQDNQYPGPIHDQVEAFFDPGQFFTNQVSLSQNAANTNWYLSYNNKREDGVVLDYGGFGQNDVRFNLDHRPRSDLSIAFSGYVSRSKRDEVYDDTFFDLINQPPDVDLLQPDPDGTPFAYMADPQGREENPLYVLATEQEEVRRTRALGSLTARWTPLSWFSLDGNVSYDRADRERSFFLDRGLKTEGFALGGLGEIEEWNGSTDALNSSLSANFIGRFGELTARTTLRGITERQRATLDQAEGEDLAVPGVPSLDNARTRSISSDAEEILATGWFAITGFDYDGRYIVDGLVRRDGSSLFGPEERWHTYYRASAAWRMAEESWWPLEDVSEFKLRLSQGTAGGRPEFEDQYETYSFTDAGGITKETLGNTELKPERATETEGGLDVIAFDRFSLQLSYAKSKVEDQLVEIPLAALYGYTSQWQNAGTVEGNTVEATLEAQVITRPNLSWRVGLVADRSRSRITEFNRACHVDADLVIAYRCAGETLGAMYGFKWIGSVSDLPAAAQARASEFEVNDDGILVWVGPDLDYRQGEQANGWGTETTIDGVAYRWGMPIALVDEDGNRAVVKIGDGNPDFHFGISNSVTWGDFTFYGLLDTQVGGQVYNRTKQRMYQYGRSADVDQAGKTQELKKITDYYGQLYAANDVNSWFVEDGGFVKLRELSVSWRVPISRIGFLGATPISGMQIALIGRNLFTWTDYSGYDPEVNSPINRYDAFEYPRYRTITGTVQLEF